MITGQVRKLLHAWTIHVLNAKAMRVTCITFDKLHINISHCAGATQRWSLHRACCSSRSWKASNCTPSEQQPSEIGSTSDSIRWMFRSIHHPHTMLFDLVRFCDVIVAGLGCGQSLQSAPGNNGLGVRGDCRECLPSRLIHKDIIGNLTVVLQASQAMQVEVPLIAITI